MTKFLLFLAFTICVKGELFNTTRLEQVKIFQKPSVKICLRTLSSSSSSSSSNDVQVVARLMVESTASINTFTAGNATIVGLQPHIWHEITFEHTIRTYVHVLDVTMGDDVIPFNKTKKPRWATAFEFKEILLLSKGAVEIENCSTPEDNASTEAANPITTTIEPTARAKTTVGKGVYPTTTLPSQSKGETTASSTTTTTETPTTTKPVLTMSPKTTTLTPGIDGILPVPTKGEPAHVEGEDASSEVNTSQTSNLPLVLGVVVGIFVLVCIALLLLRKCKRRGSQELPTTTAVIVNNEQRKDYKSVPNGID